MLSVEEINEIAAETAHYPKREAGCIDALKIVQRHRGWISDESVRDIALHLGMSPTDVDSVATLIDSDLHSDLDPKKIDAQLENYK